MRRRLPSYLGQEEEEEELFFLALEREPFESSNYLQKSLKCTHGKESSLALLPPPEKQGKEGQSVSDTPASQITLPSAYDSGFMLNQTIGRV